MKWIYLISLLFFFSCHDLPPGPDGSSIQLSVEDVSCTEVWLRLKLPANPMIRDIELLRDGDSWTRLRLATSDTLLVDEGLLPRHSYIYRVRRGMPFDQEEQTEPVVVTTLDTTSHDFDWTMIRLGDGGGSALSDVLVFSDTLVYAVGHLEEQDSTGRWKVPPSNLAKWDGKAWGLTAPIIGGEVRPAELYSICPTSSIDYWAGGALPYHWNGVLWEDLALSQGYAGGFPMWAMWGASNTDIYVVGNWGNIRHFNGGRWSSVQSGTSVSLNDVWGGLNPSTRGDRVLIAASNVDQPGDRRLLRVLSTGEVEDINWPLTDRRLSSVWFDKKWPIFVAGGGIHVSKAQGVWTEVTAVPLVYTQKIRGNGNNDVMVVGDFGIAAHFNGVSWRTYPTLAFSGIYYSVALRGNLAIAVGSDGSQAVVAIGRRN